MQIQDFLCPVSCIKGIKFFYFTYRNAWQPYLRQTRLLQKRTENGWEFYKSVSIMPQGILTCSKIIWHGADNFTSLLKEVTLRNFIDIKSPSLSARFDPVNLGSNSKHDNRYTTENDFYHVWEVLYTFYTHLQVYNSQKYMNYVRTHFILLHALIRDSTTLIIQNP
jgi:hypothetical protein